MIPSPVLTELVRTLSRVPDPAGHFASPMRSVRIAETDLRRALDDLRSAPSQMERQICIARRNQAMQNVIVALQTIGRLMEHDAN